MFPIRSMTRGNARSTGWTRPAGWLLALLVVSATGLRPTLAQSPATAVQAGGHHSCVVTPSGGAMCWGRNAEGQLGDNTNTNSASAVGVYGLASGVVAIATGDLHTCALTGEGGVKCWGSNNYGQLGVSGSNRNAAVDVPGLARGVVALEAGDFHTCALTDSGGVKCWGNNLYGQLGDGTNTTRYAPTDVIGLASGVKSISSRYRSACAVLRSGAAKCWGYNEFGQLGTTVAGPANGITIPASMTAVGEPIASISTGAFHSCAITAAGQAMCWGRNDGGQLGNGSMMSTLVATAVTGLSPDVVRISAGQTHTCAVQADGDAKCWGVNNHGQLGNGLTNPQGLSSAVQPIGLSSGVAEVSAAFEHTCVLSLAGSVRCFGANDDGRLGTGNLPGPDTLEAANATGFTASTPTVRIAGGGDHSCALDSAGGVWCWGRGLEGQLGDGANTDRVLPVRASGLASGVVAVATGDAHSCALTTSGAVKCWGSNADGQLGVAGADRNVPVDVPGLGSGAIAVEAGAAHTCALTAAGGVKCWGSNVRGQLGDGTTTSRAAAQDVAGLTAGVAAITSGDSHSCALLSGGSAQCWGWNKFGQLGSSTTPSYDEVISTPRVVVVTGNSVSAISAGGYYTCALVAGAVQCWGGGKSGQLGDGTASDSLTAVIPLGLETGVTAVRAGPAHACALKAAGVVHCWGANDAGQLGNGAAGGYSPTPVRVLGFGSSSGASIAAGAGHTCAITTQGWARCWGGNGSGQLGDGTMGNRTSPVEVMLRAQGLGFSAPATLQVGKPVTLAAVAQSALPASFDTWSPTTCGVSGETLMAANVGLCGVRAMQSGNDRFLPAPSQLRILMVIKGDQSIAFSPLAGTTIGVAPFAISATATSGLPVLFSSTTPTICTVSANIVTLAAVGTCSIGADQPGDANYNPAPQVVQSFAVTKRAQAISFAPIADSSLVAAPFTVHPTATSALPVLVSTLTPQVCTVAGSTVSPVSLGICTIAADQPGDLNYDAAPRVSRSFVIAKADQTISFAALPNRVLIDPPFALTATASSGLPVAFASLTPQVCSVGAATVTVLATGTCTIAASQPGNAVFGAASDITRGFVVLEPSPAKLTANPGTLDFGGESMATTSAAREIIITNVGNYAAAVSGVAVSNGQFIQANDCATLAPGATCTISVRFAPAVADGPILATHAISGVLSIMSDTIDSPNAIALSGTAEKSLVTHYYEAILERAPDAGGKAYWESEASRLVALDADVNEAWRAMAMSYFASAEYAGLGRDAAGFVADLYNTFLNRAPDSGGLSYWTGMLASGMPREVVLSEFMFSVEFGAFTQQLFGSNGARGEVNITTDFYRGLLARLPDNGGFAFWVQRFHAAQCQGDLAVSDQADAISRAFLGGDEYAARSRSNGQFVGDLYNAFLRRGGDLAGVRYWIEQLDNGARTRDQVRAAFLQSPEFQNRVAAVIAAGCVS